MYLRKNQLNKLEKVKDELICDFLTRRTIKELSIKHGIAETTLKMQFKSVYGLSIYEYLKTHKMTVASELLLSSEMSILEISMHLGYNNPSKFSSAFKSIYGVTPKAFRSVV